MTFLGPLQKAQVYKQAYYNLETATSYYEASNQNTEELERLKEVISENQKLVLLGYAETPHAKIEYGPKGSASGLEE